MRSCGRFSHICTEYRIGEKRCHYAAELPLRHVLLIDLRWMHTGNTSARTNGCHTYNTSFSMWHRVDNEPEPFCGRGLRPPPRTSLRVFPLAVPCRLTSDAAVCLIGECIRSLISASCRCNDHVIPSHERKQMQHDALNAWCAEKLRLHELQSAWAAQGHNLIDDMLKGIDCTWLN